MGEENKLAGNVGKILSEALNNMREGARRLTEPEGNPAATSAQVAYEAYSACTGGKSVITGDQLPDWEDLNPDVRYAWSAAAGAVADSLTSATQRYGWCLEDTDRCEHGIHELDPCEQCPGGRSRGNPHLWYLRERFHADDRAQIAGYSADGRPVSMSEARAALPWPPTTCDLCFEHPAAHRGSIVVHGALVLAHVCGRCARFLDVTEPDGPATGS